MGKYITVLFLALSIYAPSSELQELKQEEPALILKVEDEYYYSDGKESEIYGRCGVMDGKIISTVKQTEFPKENNQSNFGTGYGYQYINDTIEVNIDGKWIVFTKDTAI